MMLLPTDQYSQEKFAMSAATIALHNFHWHYAALVLFNSTLVCSVDIFIRSYEKNVVVGRGTFYPRLVKNIQQYVVFGADQSDIMRILSWMQRHEFDNTGTYIVVCQSTQWDKCNEVDLVHMLWQYKIVNVVLINNRKEQTVNGFTYFQPEDCNNILPIPVKDWESCISHSQGHCKNMYPVKFKNLHGCPIVVSTFNQVPYMDIRNGTPIGADGDLLCVITQAMNFDLVTMTPRIGYGWGKIEDNGTWTGSLADVYNGWANFSMTSASITLSRFSTFQMSSDYAVASVAWVTHPSEARSSSLKLLRPFQPYVQVVLVTSFVTVVLFKVFMGCSFLMFFRHKPNRSLHRDIVFQSWKICLGLPVNSLSTNKALLCLAVFWIWYCFLIRTLYQVHLINSLQTDVYDPEFDTIEEAIASNYTLGGGLALRDYYIDDIIVHDKWKDVESVEIEPIMLKLSQGLKFVLAMNLETAKTFLKSNPDRKLHVLPRVIVTGPTVIFFKKYSPLVKSLNIILSRLRESGIIQQIYINNNNEKVLNEFIDNMIPITMVHYTGCYIIILTGWLLSCLCLIVEILVNKRSKKCIKNITGEM